MLSRPGFSLVVNTMQSAFPYPWLTQIITHSGWVGKGCFLGCYNVRTLMYIYSCKELLFHFSPFQFSPAPFWFHRLPRDGQSLRQWPLYSPISSLHHCHLGHPQPHGIPLSILCRWLFRACDQVLSPKEWAKRLPISSVVPHMWAAKDCWRNS